MPTLQVPFRPSPVVYFGGGGVSPSAPSTSVAGGGANPAGGDTQATTKTFSVENYGAIRSPSGVIDSTTAFQKTMDALVAAGGGIFYIPPGTWVADPPALPTTVPIVVAGAGMEASIVVAKTVNGSWIGTDVSDVELRDFQFQGLANNGAANTAWGVFLKANTKDIKNVTVRRVHVRQTKSDSAIRIAGNGDLVTPATFFANRVRVEDCLVTEFYDQNPANIGVAAHGIYLFGGIKGAWAQRNYVDANFGKCAIIAQSEANDVHIEDNICLNCGQANAATVLGAYGITAYSSYTTANVVDVFICRNTIIGTAKAGIYLAAVGKYVVEQNILDNCDTNSSGLGNVGSGAIMANDNVDNAANGMGAIVGNTIIDPGFTAIYFNGGSFGRSNTSIVGNSCRVQNLALDRIGLVYNGLGCTIAGNTFRGFRRNVYLYNTADNIVGDCTIANNEFDSTGVAGALAGIVVNSVAFLLNPFVITGNRFKNCTTGVDMRTVADLVFVGNHFVGVGAAGLVASLQGIVRGVVKGNVSDSGATGLQVTLKAATAAARCVVEGNVMGACTTPLLATENTGQILVPHGANDFGSQLGVTPNQGDASVVISEPAPEVIWFSTAKTANRTVTFAKAKAYRGSRHRVLHDAPAPGAFTLAVIDQDSGATIYTIPVSSKGWVDIVFDPTLGASGQFRFAGAGTFA